MLTVRFTLLGIGVPVLAMCALAACGGDDSKGAASQDDAASESAAPEPDSAAPESDSAAPEPDSANDAPPRGPDAGDDGSTPDIDAESDASTPDAEPDATLPAPDGSTPIDILDAGPSDAVTDVVEEVSTSGTVQVLVTAASVPEKGVTIVFSNAAGALITTAVTNAQGSVAETLAAGSQVTALLGTTDEPNLVTITGVSPGDVLKVADGRYAGKDGVAEVTFKAYTQADASVADYSMTTGGCGTDTSGAAGTFDYGVNSGCTNSTGQFPVIVTAMGTVEALAWLSGTGQVVANDAGAAAPVNLDAVAWSTEFGAQSVTLVDAPDSLSAYTSFSEFASADAVSSVAYGYTNFETTSLDAGTVQSTYTSHPGFGDFDQAEADYGVTQPHGDSVFAIADRIDAVTVASPVTNHTIDLNDGLPAITGVTTSATNPVRPTFTWTAASSLSAAAATFVQAQWNDPLDDAGDLRTGNWTIIVAGSQTSVTAPLIPAASGFGPMATATWPNYAPTLLSLNGDAFATYDAIRASAAQLAPTLSASNTPLIPALPANGRARVTAFFPVP